MTPQYDSKPRDMTNPLHLLSDSTRAALGHDPLRTLTGRDPFRNGPGRSRRPRDSEVTVSPGSRSIFNVNQNIKTNGLDIDREASYVMNNAAWTVRLYTRSAAPRDIAELHRRTVERLDRLAEDGSVESIEFEVWGDLIPTGEDRTGSRRAYDEVVDWAEESGYSLAPGFERRETGTIVSEDTRSVVSVPLLCLVIYDGDGIEAVFPCSDGQRTYTVEDGLVGLERRTDTASAAGWGIDRPGGEAVLPDRYT